MIVDSHVDLCDLSRARYDRLTPDSTDTCSMDGLVSPG
jgi:hypothetical protein